VAIPGGPFGAALFEVLDEFGAHAVELSNTEHDRFTVVAQDATHPPAVPVCTELHHSEMDVDLSP
jgi:prephenate dehydrogenase